MAIKTAPIFSEELYLGNISPDVATLEGDCPESERAWVKVRQATEADNLEISARTTGTTRWTDDGVEQKGAINPRETRVLEAYLTLVDVGNFFSDESCTKPLFSFENHGSYKRVTGGYQSFKENYGSLQDVVTAAITRAIYSVNPGWNWMVDPRHNCPECGHTFEPSQKTRVREGEAVSG